MWMCSCCDSTSSAQNTIRSMERHTHTQTHTHAHTHMDDTQEMVLTGSRASEVTAETCRWTHCPWGPAACFVPHTSCLHVSLSPLCCPGQRGVARFPIFIKRERLRLCLLAVRVGHWKASLSLGTFTLGTILGQLSQVEWWTGYNVPSRRELERAVAELRLENSENQKVNKLLNTQRRERQNKECKQGTSLLTLCR